MQPRLFSSIGLFLSSYSPLGLILIVNYFDWQTQKFPDLWVLCLTASVTLLCAVLPFLILRRITGGIIMTVDSVETRTENLIGYSLPYLVSFVSVKLDDPPSLVGLGVFLALMGALTIRTGGLWLNPLLALCGYKLLEVSAHPEKGSARIMFVIAKEQLAQGQRFRAEYITDSQAYVTSTRLDGSPHVAEDALPADPEDRL